jgi:hypothetical protein
MYNYGSLGLHWLCGEPAAAHLTYVRQTAHSFRSGNLIDHILMMMEKYATNLEEVVEERTRQLVEEKKKIDTLLYRMMPS